MNDCPKCGHSNPGRAQFCEGCGASMQAFSELDDQLEQMLLKETRKGVWALGFVALATAVFPFALGFDNWLTWTMAAVFGALALWCLKAPLLASTTGLALYALGVIADAIADPTTIVQGILVKGIIISALVSAIRAGLKVREFNRQRGV